MAQAVAAARRILGMREPDSTNNEPPKPPTPLGDNNGGCEVEFRNVRFAYATREAPVFRNLNIKIEKGQYAAFVGASGCGKTTTISLLERFYEPNKGQILVDGQDIKDFDIVEYRRAVGLVPQEPVLYQGICNLKLLGPSLITLSHRNGVRKRAFRRTRYNISRGSRGCL